MSAPIPIPVHAIVDTIMRWPTSELSSGELAEIMGVHRSTISSACHSGQIESIRVRVRELSTSTRARTTHRISKAAALMWIWDCTSGDRHLLATALKASAPEVYKACLITRKRQASEARKANPKTKPQHPKPDPIPHPEFNFS